MHLFLPLRWLTGGAWLSAIVASQVFAGDAPAPSNDSKNTAPATSAAASIPATEIVGSSTSAAIENSVVKIFSTLRRPDVFKPWTKASPVEASGTGIIIEGKRILTNAHVVLYASQIRVQPNQTGTQVNATVEAIAQGIDLAVLKLEDESVFEGRQPVPRASALPDVKEPVMAFGYPTGGANLSITKGIVSRLEYAHYALSTSGLRIQIDAAINAGNSGGPAVSGDKMIGLAFSRLVNAQNIGYIIPNEEIELFLRDIADGRYDGKPAIFDDFQPLENPALRAFLKIEKGVTGVVIDEPYIPGPDYSLKKWDVLTKIGDVPIDDQGMVKLPGMPRVSFRYLVQKTARNGKAPLTILRAGQEMKLDLPVEAERVSVVRDLRGRYPAYFVFGPLVFSTVTAQFAATFEANAASLATLGVLRSPIAIRRGDKPAFPEEELVVISSFLPHNLSRGYANPVGRVVSTLNGKAVRNLVHLVELLRDSNEPFITLDFQGRGSPPIVLPRAETLAATEEILSDNGIRAQGSPDVLKAWSAKP